MTVEGGRSCQQFAYSDKVAALTESGHSASWKRRFLVSSLHRRGGETVERFASNLAVTQRLAIFDLAAYGNFLAPHHNPADAKSTDHGSSQVHSHFLHSSLPWLAFD